MDEQACSHDCASCGQDCPSKSAGPASLLEKPNRLSSVKKVIGVVSGKGGVGKSLVTSLLAVQTQRDGYRAGILDADVTGPSIPRAFGLNQKAQATDLGLLPVESGTGVPVMSLNLLLPDENDPVVWRGPVIAGAVKQFWTDVIWHDVDVLYVDMPPGTGDVPLTVFQSLPLDGVVVVTTPQQLVGMIVEKAVRMAELMHIPVLALVENMSYFTCPDCGKRLHPFGESRVHALAQRHGVDMALALPADPILAAACDAGTIELFEGDWLKPLAARIEAL